MGFTVEDRRLIKCLRVSKGYGATRGVRCFWTGDRQRNDDGGQPYGKVHDDGQRISGCLLQQKLKLFCLDRKTAMTDTISRCHTNN